MGFGEWLAGLFGGQEEKEPPGQIQGVGPVQAKPHKGMFFKVEDVPEAMLLWKHAFGVNLGGGDEVGKPFVWEDWEVTLSTDLPGDPGIATLWIQVDDDLDALHDRLKDNGVPCELAGFKVNPGAPPNAVKVTFLGLDMFILC
jgi:hypothetical protein